MLADGPVRGIGDLAGRVVSLGAPSSGAEFTARRVLAGAGLLGGAGGDRVGVRHHLLADAVTALEVGQIDALIWSGGVPTPALAALAQRRGIRLLPLADALPGLRARYGSGYEAVTVPADAYGPGAEVGTLGVPNLLVCRPELDPAVAGAVAAVLVTRAARLVPAQALGTQFLDPRSVIVSDGIELHGGAIDAYRALHG